ncbi:succinyltransferase [Corynebacterium urinipleomorphum]|uniref:succinyltransferase n=1 Tax=Corynebacterium urinipleomorphum TaxID=1852380 RepID=UPI000B35560D|nr:succinyltransferase [Corynebacterium urinipleomorphum]
MPQGARATGIAHIAADGTVLDSWFPSVQLADDIPHPHTRRVSANELSPRLLNLVGMDRDRHVEVVPVRTEIADLSAPAIDAHDVYLRLHLLSHRKVKPLEINMTDVLDHLVPVAWTNKGPCLPDDFEYVRTNLRARGTIHVYGIERLPRMVDYVVPTGITIAEAERVRLGAYLAEGTSVYREGSVSYNAGTLGPARVEGRLFSSCVIGAGCDIGLSSFVMAETTDGHNRTPIRIGENCVIRPSAGLIDLNMGDRCELGPGVILQPGTIVYDTRNPSEKAYVPARTITEQSDWTITHEPHSATPVVRHRV